jgi:hypothetical protein
MINTIYSAHYDMDMNEFKRCYDTVLNGLFDKQYRGLTDDDEKNFNASLNRLKEVYSAILE